MPRAATDWGGNLVAFSVVILVNVLSNTLPINGQTMPEISARYPSLFTPAGFTFSIWGVIYLALLLFVFWQALPAQRNNAVLERIGPWFKLNCAANASWLIAWHYDLIAVSVVIMLVILTTLIIIYRDVIAAAETAPLIQRIAVHGPFSLYAGWVTLATIANISVLQNAMALDDTLLSATAWTLAKLALAGAIGATIALRFRDPVFILVIAWGAWGIAVKQADTAAVSGAATMLSLMMLMLVVREGAARLRA